MNDYQFYEYIRQLHLFVEAQEVRVKQLEQLVKTLEDDIAGLKNKPGIRIDKIEYKFDQLKVETLEGTLNIGLNPSDLQGIEDFAIEGKQAVSNPLSPAERLQSSMRIQETILQNIDSDVIATIYEYEQENGVKLDESYITFILDDIKKQLPHRLEQYLNQIPMDQRNPNHSEDGVNRIVELIKNDIQKGILVFINNLPNEMKGRSHS